MSTKRHEGNVQGLVLRGKYEIQEQVGRGGMGKVYRCFDTAMKREVAIKEFAPSQEIDLDTYLLRELEEAFQREATLLANLRHDALPIVYDMFAENDKSYLVMEFIEGDNLRKRVKELKEKYDGQLPLENVMRWAGELLEVLSFLHERESPIYHRDIKPENLKIKNGKICLLDFGLAKGTAGAMADMSARTTFGYTERFAPVEQMRGAKTTAQTDIYALSATLYYLLTGVEPPNALARESCVNSRQPDPLQPIKQLRPEVDDIFAGVLMEGLSIEAQYRPWSARAMLSRLHKQPAPPAPTARIQIPVGAPFTPPPFTPLPQPGPPQPGPPLPRQSAFSGKWLVIVLVAGGIIGLSVVVVPRWLNSTTPTTPVVSVDIGSRLLADCSFYYNWGTPEDKPIRTLLKGSRVLIESEGHKKNHNGQDLYWYRITIPGSNETGWIYCQSSNPLQCFSSN